MYGPTPKQKKLAQSLGVELPANASAKDASSIIKEAPPSAKQLALLAELGVKQPNPLTFEEVKALLDTYYPLGCKKVIKDLRLKPGDILLKDGELWQVKKIVGGTRLSLKPIRLEKQGKDITAVEAGRGKVFGAFTFRGATKLDLKTIKLK